MDVAVRIKGIDQFIRGLAKTNDATERAAVRGIMKSAEHLKQKVEEKFGVYQSTGGTNGGAWQKLKYETIARKLRKGYGNKPLIETGAMKGSIKIIPGGKGRLAARVGSDDPKMVHHVYGAPGSGVPKRDPIIVTAEEQRNACHDIIEQEIRNVLI